MSRTETRAPAHFVDAIDASMARGAHAKVLMQRSVHDTYTGRFVQLEKKPLFNFGSCSYLGLEQRAELKEAAIDAIRRYGTQFSFSRAYLDSPLYAELESLLGAITGGHTLVTPSTSLAHISALPVLVGPDDAVLIDRSTHASVHTALALLKGIPVKSLPHALLDLVDQEVSELSKKHRHVWYVIDGLYSMLGDLAPLDEISALMDAHPQMRLYVDDAHSTSWKGKHGRGHALDFFTDRERVVVALSLNKGFSAAGGALVFHSKELRDRVQRCGGPMVFSGPVQPPMLGAAVASAKLHLDPTFAGLQHALYDRIDFVNRTSRELGIPLVNEEPTPLFYVRCGPLEPTFDLVLSLRERGYYVTTGMFPAVPHDKSGPRFTVSLSNEISDIEQFLQVLAEEAERHGILYMNRTRQGQSSGVHPPIEHEKPAEGGKRLVG